MSHWVHRIGSAQSIGEDTAQAIEVANSAPGRISTLILPADAAWGEVENAIVPQAAARPVTAPDAAGIREAANALRAAGSEAVILLTGAALRAGALATA